MYSIAHYSQYPQKHFGKPFAKTIFELFANSVPMVTKQDDAKELFSRWRSIGFLSFLKASLPVVATLPRVPCRGWRGETPSNPERQKAKSMKRTAMIKVRVSVSEKSEIENKAQLAGLTLSDFIRRALAGSRTRQTQAEREYLRLLARMGNNLNQLARWANIYKADMEAVRILVALENLRRVLMSGEGGQCT